MRSGRWELEGRNGEPEMGTREEVWGVGDGN
jgi:hypothetical protein